MWEIWAGNWKVSFFESIHFLTWQRAIYAMSSSRLWLNQIPTHTMSQWVYMFNLPTILSKELGLMMIRFWWGRKKKVGWDGKSFAIIRKNKIWDLKVFNMAFLGKQGWRLIHKQDSLAQAVLKAEYIWPTMFFYFMEAKCKPNASYTWRNILGARNVLEKGSHKQGR